MRKIAPFVGLGVALVIAGVFTTVWIAGQCDDAEARRLTDDVIEAAQKWKVEGELSGTGISADSPRYVEFSAKLERLTRQFPGHKAGKNLAHFAEAVRMAQEEKNMALLKRDDDPQAKKLLNDSRGHWSEAMEELEAAKRANR